MADLISLQKLFTDKIFRIPDYQRGYSWQSQQLREFWEDVMNIPKNSEHYTGMISLREIVNITSDNYNDEKWLYDKREYKFFHIVDGQQRLTTCIVLINEIISFIKGMTNNKDKQDGEIFFCDFTLKEIKERYLVINKPDSEGQLKSYLFGYEVDNPSYRYFKGKILGEENIGSIEETFYTLNLKNAKSFFSDCISLLYKSKKMDGLELLFLNLTQKLKFNIYDIKDDFNVFMAFETMNNRGKRLSTLELLKNRLIYLLTLFDIDEDIKQRKRSDINDTWKDIYAYLGKNEKEPLFDDEFLRAHWIIYFGYSRQKMDFNTYLLKRYFVQERVLDNVITIKDYEDNQIREEIFEDYEFLDSDTSVSEESYLKLGKLRIGDIGQYVYSLKNLIPYWSYLHFPEQSSFLKDIKNMLIKIGRMGFAYFKPLICVVLADGSIDNDIKVIFLQKVERFIFLNFRFAGYFQTYKNSFYYNISRDLYYKKKSIEDVMMELDKIDFIDNGIINIAPVMPKVMLWFKDKGYYTWGGIRNFLYEYECYLTESLHGVTKILPSDIFKKDDKDKVSIEHIYPQNGNNFYWTSRFNKYNETSRRYLANTLGNLLPLSQSINSSFQNDSFDDKKSGTGSRPRCYSVGSYSEIEVAKYDEWTVENIIDRGMKLLEFMEKRYQFKFKDEEDMKKILFVDKIEEATQEQLEIEALNNEKDRVDFVDKKSKTIEVKNLYNDIHSYIMGLNSRISFNTTKNYIGYSLGRVFAEVHIRKDYLAIMIRPGEYNDPQNQIKLCKVNWVNNLKIEIGIDEVDKVDYFKDIIKQSFEKLL